MSWPQLSGSTPWSQHGETMPAIRWLKRPRPVLYHYACDKCRMTHSNYVAPDLSSVWHVCRYKTKMGKDMKAERQMILQ